MTRSSGRMRPQTPGGRGELIVASALLRRYREGALPSGTRIRLNPGGGEYEATVEAVEGQRIPTDWVRIAHQRDGMGLTINVVPPSTEVRILE